ncbi:hypothetical protein [Legionella israelensis]|uniref:Phosphatase n=1 Tax=Legionella israelensis TaxID=454 RepID=A0A0W0V1I7_9GAMM|nr:hypothetical protein [Legionella israelensis]KTD13995.1 phosphatase [Legionella israelensis]QBS09654.1 hypothetical protein E4T55_07140 [Legionella israelensis]SCY25773.1 hypothetical protein SAMN02746069_01806 [Legionella israelensis DSM 19235]STX60585.1 phosphatase [Legionella israelensis]
MPSLTPVQMKKIAAEKEQHREKLQQLMQQPFDIDNQEQMKELQTYLDHFEFSVNTMYIFQAMSELMKLWGGSWVWGLFLPIPEFIGTILNYTLYIGVAGLVLEHFSIKDFHEELAEIQQLYNWVMKAGSEQYSSDTDNSKKLLHPEIQRMIELIAPLSHPKDIIAWKKVTDTEDESGPSFIYNAIQYAGYFFSKSSPQNTTASMKVLALKERVEKGEMTVGVLEGLKRASEYFAKNANVKKMATDTVLQLCQKPLQMLRDAAPQMLASSEPRHLHLN